MSFCRGLTLAWLVVLISGCGSDDPAVDPASALQQLGVPEADARRDAVDAVTTGQPYALMTAGRAFKAVPADDRAALVEGLSAWARQYFESDLFHDAYAERRTSSMPTLPAYDESVEQALERWAREGLVQLEETRSKVVPMLPESDRPEMLSGLDSMQAQFEDPQFIAMQRRSIEMQREADQRSFEASRTRWQAELPEDPNELIKRRLQEFLDACADVDFDAGLVEEYGQLRFEDANYERKPWAWKLCYRAGQESVGAARDAAQAWLKDLG